MNIEANIYRCDVTIKRSYDLYPTPPDKIPGQKIARFSKMSRARLLFTMKNTALIFPTMITLTYPMDYPSSGKVVKRHLKAFLNQSRRDLGQYSYVWFLEFQRRGAPHFHLLTTLEPKVFWFGAVKKSTSLLWYNVVDSGDPKHLKAGTRVEAVRSKDGAIRYVGKYCSKKNHQKKVPEGYEDVGRFWGMSAGVKPMPYLTLETTDTGLVALLDVAELPPYSTLFDKGVDLARAVPELLKLQAKEIADWTGERVSFIDY